MYIVLAGVGEGHSPEPWMLWEKVILLQGRRVGPDPAGGEGQWLMTVGDPSQVFVLKTSFSDLQTSRVSLRIKRNTLYEEVPFKP